MGLSVQPQRDTVVLFERGTQVKNTSDQKVKMSTSPITNITHYPPLHRMQFTSNKPVSRLYTIDQILGNNDQKDERKQSTVFVKTESEPVEEESFEEEGREEHVEHDHDRDDSFHHKSDPDDLGYGM